MWTRHPHGCFVRLDSSGVNLYRYYLLLVLCIFYTLFRLGFHTVSAGLDDGGSLLCQSCCLVAGDKKVESYAFCISLLKLVMEYWSGSYFIFRWWRHSIILFSGLRVVKSLLFIGVWHIAHFLCGVAFGFGAKTQLYIILVSLQVLQLPRSFSLPNSDSRLCL